MGNEKEDTPLSLSSMTAMLRAAALIFRLKRGDDLSPDVLEEIDENALLSDVSAFGTN